MISFADSTNPAAIPSQFTHVAAYHDGDFQWPAAQIDRFPAHVEIGVLGGQPDQAQFCRVLDVERFDAVPADFPPFCEVRVRLGHNDPTAYTSILGDQGFGVSRVIGALEAAHQTTWRLWIAWWWGRPFAPTAAEVLAEIRALTGIILPPGRLWACQWQKGQHYDSSVLYQRDDFTRP